MDRFKISRFATHSARASLALVSVVGLSLMATACFRPQTHETSVDADAYASFTVKSASGKAAVTALVDGTSWPKVKTYEFKVCLLDRRGKLPLKKQNFNIEAADTDAQSATTDEKGCLTWKEEINFNYLASEAYLPLKRRVATGNDAQAGGAEVKLAINPWNFAGQMTEVLDLSNEDQAKLIPDGALAKEEEVSARLSGRFVAPAADASTAASVDSSSDSAKDQPLADIRIPQTNVKRIAYDALSLTSDLTPNGGAEFARAVEVNVHPVLETLDLNKKVVHLDLKGLKLKVNAALLLLTPATQDNAAPKRYLAWALNDAAAMIETRGAQFATLPIHFTPFEADHVRYQLLLRLAPENPELGIAAFEGVFDLGSHAQFGTTGLLQEKLRTSNALDATFSLESVIQGLEALPRAPRLVPTASAPGASAPAAAPTTVSPPTTSN